MLNSMNNGDVQNILRKSIEFMKRGSRSPTPDRETTAESYLNNLCKLFEQLHSCQVEDLNQTFFKGAVSNEDGNVKSTYFIQQLLESDMTLTRSELSNVVALYNLNHDDYVDVSEL